MPDEPVPLEVVLEEVQKHYPGEDAQDIIRKAHIYGGLVLIKYRPSNRRFENFGAWEISPDKETWRRLFDTGVIEAEWKPRGWRRRGVFPTEFCPIFAIRGSLDHFLGVAVEIRSPGHAPNAPAKSKAKANKRDRAEMAVKALWPKGPPSQAELLSGPLCRQVTEWLKADCEKRGIPFSPIGDSTILRAAGRKKESRPT